MATDIPIRLACFDLGGVLVRIVQDWAEALQRAGIDPTRCSSNPAETQIDTQCDYELGKISTDHFIATQRQTNPRMTVDDIHAVIRHWLVGIYEGVGSLLDDLASKGIATACLSNTNAAHWHVMCHDPIFTDLQKLKWMIASHEIGCRKPQACSFEQVEKTTGITDKHIIFFDDSELNCHAAQQHGWLSYRIDPMANPMSQARQRLVELQVID